MYIHYTCSCILCGKKFNDIHVHTSMVQVTIIIVYQKKYSLIMSGTILCLSLEIKFSSTLDGQFILCL